MVGQRVEFHLKEDWASSWTLKNPILASGEPGFEKDTGQFKLGTGFTPWNSLDYYIPKGKVLQLIAQAIEEAAFEGVDLGYEHVQTSPSASWVIPVPTAMGRRPNVSIYIDDEEVDADVHATSTQVSIAFGSPVSGSAVLS